MTEPQAPYGDPLNDDQLKLIDRLLAVIRDLGGFGAINLVIENGYIRFIRLDNLSHKYEPNQKTR